jgi:DNA (cytosine-5)-methyltransferase 1
MVMARFKEIGYRPQLFLVNAADCGVPQRRERVFFVAIRDDIEAPPLKLSPKHRWISSGEAIGDIQDLTEDEKSDTDVSRYAIGRVASKLVKGEHTGMGFQHSIIKKDKPSPTLTAAIGGASSASVMHWYGDRKLTFREAKRLGSFPDDYHAKTDKIGKYMIGMSVPPKMTEVVARAVIEQWLKPSP